MNLISKEQEDEIFEVIHRLVQALESPDVAIDEQHTPRLHARFLNGLLSRYKRKVAGNGRRHAQQPPNEEHEFTPTNPDSPTIGGRTFPQQKISIEPALEDIHGIGVQHSSQDNDPQHRAMQAAHTGISGLGELVDFDSALYDTDDERLGALRMLKTPAYWSDMMAPGYVSRFTCVAATFS